MSDLAVWDDGAERLCMLCWRAEHPRPRPDPADIEGSRARFEAWARYIADLHSVQLHYDSDTGTAPYDRHREAFARTGEQAELERMLRHIQVA